jgi:signal transduction histidine kinase
LSDRDQGFEASSAAAPTTDASDRENRGSYLGFVAHEMRNPLSTALWSAELLARLSQEERGGARGEKLAGMCLRSLQRLRLLVEDHFLSERLDVAGIPIRLEAVGLKDALRSSVAKRPADVDLPGGEDLMVWADRGLLERALESVVAAARREGAAVKVEVASGDGRAAVSFRGAQPRPDDLEPPHRGTQSDPTGRALSLHMAVRVARALGGSLETSGGRYVLVLQLARASS